MRLIVSVTTKRTLSAFRTVAFHPKTIRRAAIMMVPHLQPLSPLQPQPLYHRTMSSEAENVVVSGQRPKEYVFVYPKAQDMFQRISSQLSADDFRRLQRETYILLGHPLREKEFYYDGIGSSGVKKGGAGGGEEDAAATTVEVKKTSFDLKLVGFDASAKIKVIKEIRSLCNLGLKEAKSLVESAPTICLKGLKTEEAEEAKKKLVEVGAEIELV